MNSSLDRLVETFGKMQVDGFDTTAQLKWGFYFIDADKERLINIFNELVESGYILEELSLVEDDTSYMLHASKIDILTPEKLHKRNVAFNELATYCDVAFYDGWDVEKIS